MITVVIILILILVFNEVFSWWNNKQYLKYSDDFIEKISNRIQVSTFLYFWNQFKYSFGVITILQIALFYIYKNFIYNFIFLLGYLFSNLTVLYAIYNSTCANKNVVYVTNNNNFNECLKYNLFQGLKSAIFTMVIFLLCTVILIKYEFSKLSNLLFILGFSINSLFGRIGGGIFTKSADVGADLTGKLNLDLNEDSYDNPATIADNVGDNVGDCSGMTTDMIESFLISSVFFTIINNNQKNIMDFMVLNISGIISNIISIFFVKYTNYNLKYLFVYSAMLLLPIIYFVSDPKYVYLGLFFFLIKTFLVSFYSDENNFLIQKIRNYSKYGAGLNVIGGLTSFFKIPMEIFILLICVLFCFFDAKNISYFILGFSLLNLNVLTQDYFGSIADNAGGIAEMSNNEKGRNITEELDKIGNTTKSVTKIYSSLIVLFNFIQIFAYISTNKMNQMTVRLSELVAIGGSFRVFILLLFFSFLSINNVLFFCENTLSSVVDGAQIVCEQIQKTYKNGKHEENSLYIINVISKFSLNKAIYLIISLLGLMANIFLIYHNMAHLLVYLVILVSQILFYSFYYTQINAFNIGNIILLISLILNNQFQFIKLHKIPVLIKFGYLCFLFVEFIRNDY